MATSWLGSVLLFVCSIMFCSSWHRLLCGVSVVPCGVGSVVLLVDFGCRSGVKKIKNGLLDVSLSDIDGRLLRMEFVSLLFSIAACFARSLKLTNGVLCLVFALLTPFGVFKVMFCCCLWFFVAICISLSLDHIVLVFLFLVAVCFFLVCFVVALLMVGVLEVPGVLVDALFLIVALGDPVASLMLAFELDGPGGPIALLIASWALLVPNGLLAAICFLASSKQNLRIFSWFLLSSPTVLHATM